MQGEPTTSPHPPQFVSWCMFNYQQGYAQSFNYARRRVWYHCLILYALLYWRLVGCSANFSARIYYCKEQYIFRCLTSWRRSSLANLRVGDSYSSISTSSPPDDWPFCRALGLGTEASLSIICRETETMLSSMSCWPTSEMSAGGR